jgi:hypothetical protein
MKNQTLISSILVSLISSGCTIAPSIAKSDLQPQNATLKGTVIYPGKFLAPQKVCAENVQTKQLFCSETRQNQSEFSISVKAGTYEIFAIECKIKSPAGGKCGGIYGLERIYYNEFAKCGTTAACRKKFKENRPILVPILSGQTISNIKPHDWYSK